MSLVPSPFSRLASATVSGLVSTAAQTWAGVKSFAAQIVAAAGITAGSAMLTLQSDLGAGSTDVAVRVGTTVADGSVNAGAKLLSARTGIGGTEVEKCYIDKSGNFVPATDQASNLGAVNLRWGDIYCTTLKDLDGDIRVFIANNASTDLNGNWATGSTTAAVRLANSNAMSTAGSLIASFHPGTTATTAIAAVTKEGRFDQSGTDSTGTPGTATINKPSGKSAIAIGAASVTITNSLVTTASRIHITPHARDATCKEIIAVPAAGSFTVSGSANATAALPFSWEVNSLL